MVRRALLVALALVLVSCGGAPQEHAVQGPTLAQRLDAELAKQGEEAGVPGVAGAVVAAGKPVWSGAWGMADVAQRRKMTPETPMALGSVTKTYTASMALRLAEQGRLSLDAPIRRWLPEWRGAPRMPVRRLLAQTAGVQDPGPQFYERAINRARRPATPADWIAAMPRPLRDPSDTPVYANANYILAGLVVKRAAGREWRLLLPPPGSGLALQPDQTVGDRPARGYWYPPSSATRRPWGSASDPMVPSTGVAGGAWTAGGLAGSVAALAGWADDLLTGGTLDPASVEQMATFNEGSALWQGYGLGLARQTVDGREVWGHVGHIPGFHTVLWHVPDDDLTWAVAWNDERVSVDVSPRAMLNVALDAVR
jgi:D-alanyl-D-alanine carboxypeptidase